MSKQEDFYNPKEKIVDPEEYSTKTYLFDIGQTLTEIKSLLAMLVDKQVNLSQYVDDEVTRKEMAMKVIRRG